MINKTCECGISFSYEANPNYPDRRKYCDKCSAEKKASYEARQTSQVLPKEAEGKTLINIPAKGNEVEKETGTFQSTVWNHSVAGNSYEIGPVGNRFKIYFETVDELKIKINELKLAGLLDNEIRNFKL